MPESKPRAVVHCILRRGAEVLLIRLVERGTGRIAWRAPGGGIEWRETAEEAVRREIREEVGVDLAWLRLVEVIEALGHWNGNDEHELIWMFEGEPAEQMEGGGFVSCEANGEPLDLHWVRPVDLTEELYPPPLARLLRPEV